jgi:pimeloyl-ACP methyl ester carboxylesterase
MSRRETTATALRTLGIGAAALGGLAALNLALAKLAEWRTPPIGRFITVRGVRLHYLDTGARNGQPLVLIHGNASLIQDFTSSGLIALAAKRYRVIAFDRPGYGYSARPRGTVWTPAAQADLLNAALKKLGIANAIVLGHSLGASVAMALGLKQESAAGAVVLASGYYYPTLRLDVALVSLGAVPVLGDLFNHTTAPMVSRLIWPLLLRKMFGPAPVPRKFKAFPKEMAFRPSQIRAGSVDAALMIPNARAFQKLYRALKIPAVIVTGEGDRLVDPKQSARLHSDIGHSRLNRIPRTGHMVHQTATRRIMAAIDLAAHRLEKRANETPGRGPDNP